jgi:pyruvate dehydrogenase (quinone)
MVLVNHDLNQVTWEQRALAGDPKFSAAQDVEDFPYARYGEMLGFKGIRVDDPERIADAWREAFAADRPVVIEFVTDPDVPPLPPHITWAQARAYMSALGQGDPDRRGVIRQTLREVLAGWID